MSKELKFIKEFKSSLREKGVRIKKKDLVDFFCFIDEKCPWLVLTGPGIHLNTWDKVEKNLSDRLKNGEQIPEAVLSYWFLIREVINSPQNGGQGSRILTIVTDFLCKTQTPDLEAGGSGSRRSTMTDRQGRSKPSSPCPSVVVDIPEPLTLDSPSPEVKSTVKIIRGEMKTRKNIYPSLATVKQ